MSVSCSRDSKWQVLHDADLAVKGVAGSGVVFTQGEKRLQGHARPCARQAPLSTGPQANCTQSFWVLTGVTDTGEEAPGDSAGGWLEAREGEGSTRTPPCLAECRSRQSLSCQHADCQLQPLHFHYLVFKEVTFSTFRKSKLHF